MSVPKDHVWQVGQRVLVKSTHGGWGPYCPTFRRVTKITKRFVELNDGSKWSLDGGYSYPRPKSAFNRSWIVYPIPQDELDAERRYLLITQIEKARTESADGARKTPWETVPLETLQAVLSLLQGDDK